nr:hypothetical protein [uncultured Flavobacterium sp.]
MTYVKTSVRKAQGSSPGAAAPKEPNIAIYDVDDILVHPMRDSKNVLITNNIICKPGTYPIEFYMTPSKTKTSYEPEGDEDAVSFKQKVEGEHPGNDLEIAEFIQNWTGRNCIIVIGSCTDKFRKVYGTKCAPMQLKASLQDDNDARKHVITFEQSAKAGYVPGHYTGVVIFRQPNTIANVAAVNFTEALGAILKVPALAETDELTVVGNEFVHGTMITLIGQGGAAPATITSGTDNYAFILQSDWVALEGANLNVEVFVSGNNTYFIEKSRF